MEQSMLVLDSTHESEVQNDGLTTPSRAQKRLFLPSSSSSKRSLFRETNKEIKKDIDSVSDTESDLGPMSPLALTDHSSCDSSPGRQFISPLATPEKSPTIPLSKWNCFTSDFMQYNSSKSISPFSSLRKATRTARFSPRRIFSNSPKSKRTESFVDENIILNDSNLGNKTLVPDDIVPETPGKESDFDDQQSYVAETPQKEEMPEYRLITPLGSVCKNIPIPRIHRRKSLCAAELNECTSPEIKKCNLKRRFDDTSVLPNSKYQKIDESVTPRARAALFQENHKKNIEKEKGFTLNTKSFYGSSEKSRKSIEHEWREPQIDYKKRRSLPTHTSISKRSTKKPRRGEINCGVGHGIRRPKPKRQSFHNIAMKVDKQSNDVIKHATESKENLNPQHRKTEDHQNKSIVQEEVNPNKKFFKIKPTNNATVTVNHNIKLKLPPNEKNAEHVEKRAKLDEKLFDAADLSVDEPAVEENKVANILEILENDWAEDEYDSMETSDKSYPIHALSPNKARLKNLTMSPGSELSNMASTMNIDDISYSEDNLTNDQSKITKNSTAISTRKFYPLFSKGYSSNVSITDECNSKKRKRTNAWQLSAKTGSSENQYQIDAGQRAFGATQCNECGIVYQIGEPEDENAHLNYHNSFKILKFQGWKNERIVFKDSYTSSRIIVVEPKDSNLYWKKVNEILEIVDRDLGLSDMKLSFYRDKRVYIYVRDKTILGILVAEYVKSAFKMIPELMELNCCTSETSPVKCGINVVWTAMSHRKQGIATKLVDTVRAHYYYGYIMSVDDIAFSTPTPSGKLFAEKYTKTRNFKVY